MTKGIFLVFIVLAVVGSVICYFVYRQGVSEGSDMTRDEYNNIVSDLNRSIDSLSADRKIWADSAMNVQLKIGELNERNDTLISQLYNLNYQHKILKQQYAKIRAYDSFRRSDIIRYVADSVTAPVK